MFKSLLGSRFYNCGDEHTNILDLLAIVRRIFGELQKVELLCKYEKEERLAIHKKISRTLRCIQEISISVFVRGEDNTNADVFKAESGYLSNCTCVLFQKNGAHFMLIHRSVFFTRVYAHEYVGIEILAGIFQVEVKKRA